MRASTVSEMERIDRVQAPPARLLPSVSLANTVSARRLRGSI